MTTPEVKTLVGEYLAVLDEQARLQEAAVGRLKGMSAAMTSRDERALEILFKEADEAHDRLAQLDDRRRATGHRLAAALHCGSEDLTLKRLARELPAPEGRSVEACRRRLRTLVDDIRRQHLRTVAMLGECARLNRTLLAGLFTDAENTALYGAHGQRSPRRPADGLLDARS
ncbi:MAG: flagellar export chaperone FlgN [Planctomycetota bacterium]|nr:flagellar export chaperone FlgN [Planctomycetota bacterium]